jgi:two-component system response regulator AdeR
MGAAKQHKDIKILIVEDTLELAEIIVETLRHMDIEGRHVTSGAKAIVTFDEIHPDLVLLDIGLPDINGWKVLDEMRERQGPDGFPPIIVITSHGDASNRIIGKFQGVARYLIKPVTPDKVATTVGTVLGVDASPFTS